MQDDNAINITEQLHHTFGKRRTQCKESRKSKMLHESSEVKYAHAQFDWHANSRRLSKAPMPVITLRSENSFAIGELWLGIRNEPVTAKQPARCIAAIDLFLMPKPIATEFAIRNCNGSQSVIT